LARSVPATLIVFDLLYQQYQPIFDQPLTERRRRLEALVKAHGHAQLMVSEGVTGAGKAFFQAACRQGLEGGIAERLSSRSLPGTRTDAWTKIKRGDSLQCAIIGFLPSGQGDFRSLILAAFDEGKLHCVGKVGTGFDRHLRTRLNELLWSRLRPRPLVPC